MKLSEAKEGRFYKANVHLLSSVSGRWLTPAEVKTAVVKCTQIQDFTNTPSMFEGYSVYHFKTRYGEQVVADGSGAQYVYNSIELIEEITNEKMKDTSIEFIDDTHYKKLVNKGKWKEYEV